MTPYYEHGGITIYHGDCREVLPTLRGDLVFADPPYGVGKAAWDASFPSEWMPLAAECADLALAVTPGIVNILDMPKHIGPQVYRWTLSVRISNALVRSAIGFGNWIPCLVYSRVGESVYACAQDAGEISIKGVMPQHPSPKPMSAMRWFLRRLPGHSVIDPFAGSGTTLVAAKALGMRAIGIEIEERYCEIAAERLAQEVLEFSA